MTTGPGAVGTDVAAADVVAGAEEVWGDEPAEETQSQTALADAWTARPVWAPQPLNTQSRAALLIAAVFLHWHAKSVGSVQPTPEAALSMQVVWISSAWTNLDARLSGSTHSTAWNVGRNRGTLVLS